MNHSATGSENNRPVYSTDRGRLCPECGLALARCLCRNEAVRYHTDDVIHLYREVKGRKGKVVTIITGIGGSREDLKEMARQIKQALGTGGSIQEGDILIQGDHRTAIKDWLSKRGLNVKISGG